MSKQKFNVGTNNKYTVLDAFRFFFILLVSMLSISFVFDLIVTLIGVEDNEFVSVFSLLKNQLRQSRLSFFLKIRTTL